MKRTFLAGVLAAVAITLPSLAPAAHATPQQDAAFYQLLHSVGMNVGPHAVSNAYAVCEAVWDEGLHPEAVAWAVLALDPGLYTIGAARAFVAASMIVYCPPADGPQMGKMAV
ncbi:hypothetical protein SEA_TESLA_61 [Mycobacterium phage Tesla]|uniref:DUF732 domain-containing protein n=11 Tax=Marvinvirus TaxID=1982091 RepID=A0A3S9U975_9CAUD|nr:hypothetical protein FH33_gp061 [Mycobacterium phage MosMoris]YP_009614178.1 hypothetical protein FDI61_gp060 [Mycobacterium phage Marvin]ANM46284.1 hypothetical protein SEA_GATTACA_62 [Mycobacterium phage Gattaca]AVE00807.1 hypothetical protein SEA_TESLA_61 [Mycobacterium phage Tesla]AZS06828.1 hypothetical protein SEA_RAELA_64 [Mycobacterium phage Raela]QAX93114.1 hypothetical protein SEA_REDRAIDER77_63 [Mycobacterium phage RedRaider77]QBQ71354.1 hypothetical protein SEA_BLACKBEETLE_64 [